MKKFFRHFIRDERGQALPFFTVFSLIMGMTIIINYNVGQTVSEKMRAQNVADSAAYTAAVWQARFLNYCAYTRRAIIANWCNIASMNVMKSNQRMFDRIGDEKWFASDEDDGKEKDDQGIIAPTASAIAAMMDISVQLTEIPGDHRLVAEQMNKLMSNSQRILFEAVKDPEQIMQEVAEASGEPGWTEEFELHRFNFVPGIFGFNMELDNLVERRTIPVDEVRWQFDRYTLPLLPFNGMGYGPMAGRKWEMHYYGCCATEPFYSNVRIKWAKPQVPKDPFQPKMGLLRPYADIMDQQEESDSGPRDTGRYIVSHEGKGKHRAEPDDKKVTGAYCLYIKKCGKYCEPNVVYEFYSGPSTEPYELVYHINELEVYEVQEDIDDDEMEPSVYCAIRRPVDQIGYLRLLRLENPHDIMAISRAKVNFVSPDENLANNRMSKPNLNYPFWTAKLAPFDYGNNAFILKLIRLFPEDYFINTFGFPRSIDY